MSGADVFDDLLPPGRTIDLPGRGTTFVREIAGPAGAPTLFLLHGWTANADLNWITCYDALGTDFNVVAIDHRGHGRGIRTRRRFRLADCADDVAAACDVLGLDRVVPVGYSMGGPIAQLTWRRHPHIVEGLVLCATSRHFSFGPASRLGMAALPTIATGLRMTPGTMRRRLVRRALASRIETDPVQQWVMRELQRNDVRMVTEAGAAIGRFASQRWIGEVDVPTAVVVTEYDRLVPADRQRKLASSIPGASVHPVPGDHGVVGADPDRFVPVLLDACRSVTARARAAA